MSFREAKGMATWVEKQLQPGRLLACVCVWNNVTAVEMIIEATVGDQAEGGRCRRGEGVETVGEREEVGVKLRHL